MRKFLALITAASISLLPLNAFAAVKAGSTCTKLGATSTTGDKRYTCIKSGKKLVWDKGVKVVTPKPIATPIPSPSPTPSATPIATPTSTPTATPTPIPTPTPTLDRNKGALRGTQFIYRINNGVLERKISGSNEYTSTDSRSNSEFDQIRVKAFNEIHNFQTSGSHPNVEITYTITDNYPKDIAEAVKNGVEFAANFLSTIISEQIRIAVTLVTEKDKDFINTKVADLSRPDQVQNALNSVNRYQPGSIGGGSGSAGFNREGPGYRGGFYLGTAASTSNVGFFWPEVPSHELAHVLQLYFTSRSNTPTEDSYYIKFPTNFIEGSANTLGHAWAVNNLGWYSDESDYTVKRYMQGYPGPNKMESESDVIEMLAKTADSKDPIYFEMTYPVGQVLWEYLIGTYGFDKYITFLRNTYSTNSYEENLQLTFGISKAQIYKNAAPYILSVWKRAMSLPLGL